MGAQLSTAVVVVIPVVDSPVGIGQTLKAFFVPVNRDIKERSNVNSKAE
jgi:hypothetical protein